MKKMPFYGLMAEFEDPDDLVHATKRAHDEGYRHMDTYSPFPIEEVSEILGIHHSALPLLVLIGGILGALFGYLLQYYTSAIDYPLNVGGRPYHSWPSFIPITFEVAVLGAGLTTVFGMLIMNRLPQPYHPVFNVPEFSRVSRNHFFICIEANDAKFDRYRTWLFLQSLKPRKVYEVPC